jgi:hypothetical protein
MRRSPEPDRLIAQIDLSANGAFAMQAAPCGDHAGISG